MKVLRLGAAGQSPSPPGPLALPSPAGAVAVGNFDGVHRGHQALVRAAVHAAQGKKGPCVALTFDPHPAQVLAPDRAPKRIMTLAQKEEHLGALGVDLLAVLPFTPEVAAESPEGFVRGVLAGQLGARCVVVGEDFRFGAARAGDVAVLQGLGGGLGFDVVAVAPVREGDGIVSSTRIREALAQGDVDAASLLLGRPHFVDGRVVSGQARGRTLGFPTANLAPGNEILPREGVYAVLVSLEAGSEPAGAGHPAVANLGRRPTFGGGEPSLEAHILGWSGELYGRSLRVSFMARLREELRFDGPQALKAQIHADVAAARLVLGSRVIVRDHP